jgi:hypothetical protein
VRVSGKADRAEGLLRLRDTDTSLITFREKQLSLAQTSLLPTKSPDTRNKRKRDAALQRSEGVCSGLGGRRRHTLQDNLILQARVLTLEGGSSTLGIDDTFGEVRPSLGRRQEQQSHRQPSSRPIRGQRENPLSRREDNAPVFRSSNGSCTRNGRPANHSPRRINSAVGQAAPLAGEADDASPSP